VTDGALAAKVAVGLRLSKVAVATFPTNVTAGVCGAKVTTMNSTGGAEGEAEADGDDETDTDTLELGDSDGD
jgi:hypothetical protein